MMKEQQHKRLSWTAPIASPKIVAKFFNKSLRNLNHLIQTTIGDPVKPARGRGFAAQFSLQDIVLMSIGSRLLGSSTPPRVRRCVEEIRKHWTDVTIIPEWSGYYNPPQDVHHEYYCAWREGWIELYNPGTDLLGCFWVNPANGGTLPDVFLSDEPDDWPASANREGRVGGYDIDVLLVQETEHGVLPTVMNLSEFIIGDFLDEDEVKIIPITTAIKRILKRWVNAYGMAPE